MTPLTVLTIAAAVFLIWVTAAMVLTAAVAFATGGTYPTKSRDRRMETVSCSNF